MECNASVPNNQWLPEWKQMMDQWGLSQQCLPCIDGLVVTELLRLLRQALSRSRWEYVCKQSNNASWTMRQAVPRRIGWRMTATEGQVASLPEINHWLELYTQLGGIVQCWLLEHHGLDALALLVIVWQATENIH